MRTTTVGDVRILLPDLDPDDLDRVTELADGLTEAFVEGASWRGVQLEDCRIRGSRIAGGDLSESTWEAGSRYGCEITRTDFSGAALVGMTSWAPANSTGLTCAAATSTDSSRHWTTCPASPSPRANFPTSPSWPSTPWD